MCEKNLFRVEQKMFQMEQKMFVNNICNGRNKTNRKWKSYSKLHYHRFMCFMSQIIFMCGILRIIMILYALYWPFYVLLWCLWAFYGLLWEKIYIWIDFIVFSRGHSSKFICFVCSQFDAKKINKNNNNISFRTSEHALTVKNSLRN